MIWLGVAALTGAPVVIAAYSPLLGYRGLDYIVGGFAGIVCLSLLLLQPLLAAGYLPGLNGPGGRDWHRWVGAAVVVCVAAHVGGLYLTSPADTWDALALVAPTPFSIYGVTAMWGVVVTAILVAMRRRLGLRYSAWRLIHNAVACVVVVSTVIHAVQIQGAMEIVSKWVLCVAALLATAAAMLDLRLIRPLWRKRQQALRAAPDQGPIR